jgi:CRP-like cAMP-binding protein
MGTQGHWSHAPDLPNYLGRLPGLAAFGAEDLARVRSAARRSEWHPKGAELTGNGAPIRPKLVLSGWAARQRTLSDGRRQILGFALPGDLTTAGWTSAIADYDVVALTPLEVIDLATLREVGGSAIDGALARAELQEAARLLDQIVRLGSRSALERTAHLLLELSSRLTAAGLTSGGRFPLPLYQETLADALGLSVVHTNRTLQALRRAGLIKLRLGSATILDSAGLKAVSIGKPLGEPREPAPCTPSEASSLQAAPL